MTAVGKLLQPLSAQVPIVDPKTGCPTTMFQRLLQQLGLGSSLSSSNGKIDLANGGVSNAKLANMAFQMIKARKSAGPGAPEDVALTDVLDFIDPAVARGDILFRGNGGWKRLAAGTAGKVLQTNGAGADPTWVTPSAGGGGSIFPINAPPFGSATLINMGTSTFTTNADGSVTLIAQDTGADSIRAAVVALGGATYDHRIGFIPSMPSAGFAFCGVCLRESSSGKLVIFGCYRDSSTGTLAIAMNYNSPTSKNANVVVPSMPSNIAWDHPVYLHLKDDGTNRTCTLGFDPWLQPFLNYSVASGSFLVPDQIGIFFDANGTGASKYGLTCFDWR